MTIISPVRTLRAADGVWAQMASRLRLAWERMSIGPGAAHNIGPVAEVRLRAIFAWSGGRYRWRWRQGAEEEIGGVGQDSGAAGSDLVAGLELIEFAEGMVDVGGRCETPGCRR